ncbi:MAG TPA: hypothetical protein VHN58_04450 [Croceicoccus sp.]|nr:hypothetical protein [Croceicoccus sp.]
MVTTLWLAHDNPIERAAFRLLGRDRGSGLTGRSRQLRRQQQHLAGIATFARP